MKETHNSPKVLVQKNSLPTMPSSKAVLCAKHYFIWSPVGKHDGQSHSNAIDGAAQLRSCPGGSHQRLPSQHSISIALRHLWSPCCSSVCLVSVLKWSFRTFFRVHRDSMKCCREKEGEELAFGIQRHLIYLFI